MTEIAQPAASATDARPTTNVNVGRVGLQAVAIAIVGGWAGYFLFTEMPQFTLLVFPRTLVLHLMFAGLAAVYAAFLIIARRLPGGSPLDLPVLAFLGAYGLATLTSISWRVSLEPLLFLAAVIIVFYALSDLPWLTARSLSVAWLLVMGALALYALWVVGNDYYDYVQLVRRVEGLSGSNIFPPTVPRVHGVSDHPNVLAMVLVLALPFFT